MKKIALLAAAAGVLAGTSVGFAMPAAEAHQCGGGLGINGQQANQQNHIWQGFTNGQLTPQEAARLERRERHLAAMEARMRNSGGILTANERFRLNHGLNQFNRQIYRQRHDGQYRF